MNPRAGTVCVRFRGDRLQLRCFRTGGSGTLGPVDPSVSSGTGGSLDRRTLLSQQLKPVAKAASG
jgi:hypothetical protein